MSEEAKSAIEYKMRIARSVAVKAISTNPILWGVTEQNKYEKVEELAHFIAYGKVKEDEKIPN